MVGGKVSWANPQKTPGGACQRKKKVHSQNGRKGSSLEKKGNGLIHVLETLTKENHVLVGPHGDILWPARKKLRDGEGMQSLGVGEREASP